MSLSVLSSATDPRGLQLNPNFNSLLVHGPTTLGGNIGASGASGSMGSIYLPPASAPGTAGSTSTAPLSQYDEQVIASSPFTGANTSTCTLNLRKVGKMCYVQFASVSATSAATAINTFTNPLPTGYTPANAAGGVSASVAGQQNGAVATIVFSISSTGVITCGVAGTTAGTPAAFTNLQTYSWAAFCFAYASGV